MIGDLLQVLQQDGKVYSKLAGVNHPSVDAVKGETVRQLYSRVCKDDDLENLIVRTYLNRERVELSYDSPLPDNVPISYIPKKLYGA